MAGKRVFTEEHRANISLANSVPRPWRKGIRFTEEHKEKISKAHKGKIISNVTRLRLSKSLAGKPSPLKGRKGHSAWNKGTKGLMAIPWNKGLTGGGWTEARRKAQEARKGKPNKVANKVANGKTYKKTKYNGGVYCVDWHSLRKKVYKRDNWFCQECGVKCHNSTKRRIQCHHIDYDKANNDFFNLITLCASCHCKTNFKKRDWKDYYKNKMGV